MGRQEGAGPSPNCRAPGPGRAPQPQSRAPRSTAGAANISPAIAARMFCTCLQRPRFEPAPTPAPCAPGAGQGGGWGTEAPLSGTRALGDTDRRPPHTGHLRHTAAHTGPLWHGAASSLGAPSPPPPAASPLPWPSPSVLLHGNEACPYSGIPSLPRPPANPHGDCRGRGCWVLPPFSPSPSALGLQCSAGAMYHDIAMGAGSGMAPTQASLVIG